VKIGVLVPTLVRRGGVPRVAIEETKGLRKLGYDTVCYSFVGKKKLWEIFADTPITLYPNIPLPVLRQSLNCWFSWHIPPKINVHVAICHDAATLPVGHYLKKKREVKYVPYMHDVFGYAHPLAYFSSFRHRFFRPIERKMEMEHLSLADLLIVNSSFMIKQLLDVHPDLNVKTKILHPATHLPKPLSIKREDFILFAARLHRGKRIEFLLDVIAQIPDAKLIIAGTPTPHIPIFLRKIKQLNLKNRVQIISPVSEKRLSQLYWRARLFVHTNEESFGMPALEALAHGCPIIHPYPSGIWDLAQDGIHGFKIDKNDSQDFINKIGKLLYDERLAEKMGKDGAKLAREHTWETHNRKLEIYLNELLI